MTALSEVEEALVRDLIIPESGDDNFRAMVVSQPFSNPPDSFRAGTVSDMYFVTPERTEFSTLEFDIGLDPKIAPIIFSIQNRCLNMTLRVNLTIPSWLRSNLGFEFLVPAIGDNTLSPISSDSAFVAGSGKGLINVTLTFSEAQANTLIPNIHTDKIIFDIFPNDTLTGPVFVSTVVGTPKDLNGQEEEFPVDDDVPISEIPAEPVNTFITEAIEVEVPVPTLAPGFTAGVDGVTNDGISFIAGSVVNGPAPIGWTTEADGRSYPPIIPDPVCDPVTGAGPDGIALEDIPEEQLTPLQKLLLESKSIPRTFGSLTQRRGFLIEPRPFLEGNSSNISTVVRLSPQVVVADSIPGRTDFKIIARGSAPIDSFTTQINDEIDANVAAVKEGQRIGSPFGSGFFRRLFVESLILTKILEEGDRLEVKKDQNTPEELQIARVVGPAASILFNLKNEGAGE